MVEQEKTVGPPTEPGAFADIMRLFMTVDRLHHVQVERRVASLGIHHSQHRMLMYLARCEVMPSQRELADAMNISPAAVTTTLKCLEKEGYITREMTVEDNRRNQVSITEEGRRKVNESRVIFDSVDNISFAGFSDAELEELRVLLFRMLNNLSPENGHTGESDKF